MTKKPHTPRCSSHRGYPAGACPLCDQAIKAIVDRMAR